MPSRRSRWPSLVAPLAATAIAAAAPAGIAAQELTLRFAREIQPIFDRHCVSCHDTDKKAGEKLNLAGDRDAVFDRNVRTHTKEVP